MKETPNETAWATAGRALAAGDLETSLGIYREIDAVPDTALVHLLLAERLVAESRRVEANGHLDEALAFYRSVGATRFIREAETLLPATA